MMSAIFLYLFTPSPLSAFICFSQTPSDNTVHISYMAIGYKAKSVIRPIFALFVVSFVNLLIKIIGYMAILLIRPIFPGPASGLISDMYCIRLACQQGLVGHELILYQE